MRLLHSRQSVSSWMRRSAAPGGCGMDASDLFMRKVNLVELLLEELEVNENEEGRKFAEPTRDEIEQWSENEIRTYFCSAGRVRPQPKRHQEPPKEVFAKWFPGVGRLQTSNPVPCRILCFHNAGNAEDMYTSEGTGARRVVSPLLEWCRRENVECLAPQLPGRGMRRGEPPILSASAAAEAILEFCQHQLSDTPYIVLAHSMGCWIAYELLILARKRGVPMPMVAFFSGMPSPDIPFEKRPWRQQHTLNDAQFKEECRRWDINDIIFSEDMWKTYEPLLRSDFQIFDAYEWQHHADEAPFPFPIHAFWGQKDRRVTQAMVQGWETFTTEAFTCEAVDGNHLWPLDKRNKTTWLQSIVQKLLATFPSTIDTATAAAAAASSS